MPLAARAPMATCRRDSGLACSTSGRPALAAHPAGPWRATRCARALHPGRRSGAALAAVTQHSAPGSAQPTLQQHTPAPAPARRRSSNGGPAAPAGAASGSGATASSSSGSSSGSGAPAAVPAQQHAPAPAPLWEPLAMAALAALAAAPPALADDTITYNGAAGEGLIKGLSGILYLGLLGFFLFRTFNRRARQAREERLAGQGQVRTVFTGIIEKAREKPPPKATPLSCLIGALQAGAIAFGLFIFTAKVEGAITGQSLPDAYTARNIAVTVRTIIIGLLYLVTFIFSANAVGLTGLSFQLLFFPESVKDDDAPRAAPTGPQLPKIKVTSSRDEIRRAFESVATSAGSTPSASGAATPAPAAAARDNGSGASGSDGSGTGASAAAAAGGQQQQQDSKQ